MLEKGQIRGQSDGGRSDTDLQLFQSRSQPYELILFVCYRFKPFPPQKKQKKNRNKIKISEKKHGDYRKNICLNDHDVFFSLMVKPICIEPLKTT